MQLSETVKLYMTREQKSLITATMTEYINTVNSLVSDATNDVSILRYTSADVKANLQSALINQCIRDAKSIVKKYNKACRDADRKNAKFAKQGKRIKVVPTIPVLKRPCCYINNQNFKINGDCIEFPVMMNDKSKRLSVRTKMSDKQKHVFAHSKLGTMRIVYKGSKIVAQVVYEAAEPIYNTEGNVMGVDLGIKCPAVSYISDGSVKFYGNGRKNKYMRRHYRYLRKKLQKAKHIDAVKRINDKEQRIMKDIDHKLSHDIVETAVAHDVKTIKLERLANIRSTTRTSRKNNNNLHSWSFYRLAQFIEYKAKLTGIAVEYVNPAYTSQTCPVCGHVHHADDRNYVCKCGFHIHRDVLGAMNICNSTEYVGDSKANSEAVRHTA
jgi:IS605 OrfB family transposase